MNLYLSVKLEKMTTNTTILVTGGSGYIGSWIVKYLLEKGSTVHVPVRDPSNEKKLNHLLQISKNAPGTLIFFEADLLKDGSFDQAMRNCETVIHVASPFIINGIKNAQKQLVEPALQGTQNVLASVNKTPSVKRVVLTSSVVSMVGDAADAKGKRVDETSWNTTSSLTHNPYPYSKVLAEKEAWKIHDKQNRWDLLVINPGFVMGPALGGSSDSASIGFIMDFIKGKNKMGVPDLEFGFVDVRDVANAHLLAMDLDQSNGRNILVNQSLTMLEFAGLIQKSSAEKLPLPHSIMPKPMLYLLGWTQGVTWKFIRQNVGFPLKYDHSKSINELKISYTPMEKTVADHLEQLKQAGKF